MVGNATELRIGVNARAFSVDQPGGDVQAGINLVRELIGRDDTEVVLFGHRSLQMSFDCEVVTTGFPVDSQVYGLAWEQSLLPTLADRSNVDVLFCPNGNGPVRRCSKPVVLWIHSIFAYNGMGPTGYKQLQRVRVPRMLAHSDVIATPSVYLQNEIKHEFDLDETGFEVIPNGVRKSLIRSDPSPVDVPDPFILHVGGLNRRKNHQGLLKGYETLLDRTDAEYDLVLVGPRSHDLIYEEQSLRTDDYRDRIHNLGFVSESVLRYLYETTSLFVFPSLLETFGLPPVEAMYFGAPVVASNTSSLPEVLGDAAHYVEPSDPESIASGMQAVLTDREYTEEMSAKGKRKAAEYTWDNAAEKAHRTLSTVLR